MRSIELNGVQVENNKAAFEWGRRCAHDLGAVTALFEAQQVIQIVRKPSVDELVARRVEFLAGYQDAAYAQRYKAFVDKVRTAEKPLGTTRLSEAVARCLFKLMAYKDEYAVARLHTDRRFSDRIEAMFEGDYKIVHHLSPPAMARKNERGELIKQPYGPWMRTAFGVLARMKGLRGTALDIFGRTEERRMECALIDEYRTCVEELLLKLDAGNVELAAEIARLPEEIRGYGSREGAASGRGAAEMGGADAALARRRSVGEPGCLSARAQAMRVPFRVGGSAAFPEAFFVASHFHFEGQALPRRAASSRCAA